MDTSLTLIQICIVLKLENIEKGAKYGLTLIQICIVLKPANALLSPLLLFDSHTNMYSTKTSNQILYRVGTTNTTRTR